MKEHQPFVTKGQNRFHPRIWPLTHEAERTNNTVQTGYNNGELPFVEDIPVFLHKLPGNDATRWIGCYHPHDLGGVPPSYLILIQCHHEESKAQTTASDIKCSQSNKLTSSSMQPDCFDLQFYNMLREGVPKSKGIWKTIQVLVTSGMRDCT